jgi:hypothetical protein
MGSQAPTSGRSKKSALASLAVSFGVSALLSTSGAQAADIVFNLSTPSNSSNAIRSFTKDSLTITFDSPTGADTINTNSAGLCVFENFAPGGCGNSTTENLTAVEFSFDADVRLLSYDVSIIRTMPPGQTAVFTTNFIGSTTQSFTQTLTDVGPPPQLPAITHTFSPAFTVAMGEKVTLSTTDFPQGSPEVGYRIDNLRVSTMAPVPGPLPLFGAATAFGFSRKLRKRINVSTSA